MSSIIMTIKSIIFILIFWIIMTIISYLFYKIKVFFFNQLIKIFGIFISNDVMSNNVMTTILWFYSMFKLILIFSMCCSFYSISCKEIQKPIRIPLETIHAYERNTISLRDISELHVYQTKLIYLSLTSLVIYFFVISIIHTTYLLRSYHNK